MFALAGKVLLGLSFGMASSFVLGATSVGLWTLAWPAIVLTGAVGGVCWIIGKATQKPYAASGDSPDPEESSDTPPPYEEQDEKQELNNKTKGEKAFAPKPFVFVTPQRPSKVSFAASPATTTRTVHSVPTPSFCGTPHPRAATRVEVRPTPSAPPFYTSSATVRHAGTRVEVRPSSGPSVPSFSNPTTVRHVGTRSVRVC